MLKKAIISNSVAKLYKNEHIKVIAYMKPAAYVCDTGTFMSEVEAVSSFHIFLSGLGLFLTVVEILFTIGIY